MSLLRPMKACPSVFAIPGLRMFHASCSVSGGKQFTKQESDQIAQLYKAETPISEISGIIGRSEKSISTKLRRSGLLTPKYQHYTAQEKAMLLRLKGKGLEWDEIGRHFPDRELLSLQKSYCHMMSGCSRLPEAMTNSSVHYTAAEDKVIIDLRDHAIPSTSWNEIARKLGNGRNRIGVANRYACLKPDKSLRTPAQDPRQWSLAQVEELIRCEGMRLSEIAARIGRSKGAISRKLCYIKESNSNNDAGSLQSKPLRWSAEQMVELRRIGSGDKNWQELAARTGRTVRAVYVKWWQLEREDRRRMSSSGK